MVLSNIDEPKMFTVYIRPMMHGFISKSLTGYGMDCGHPLVLNNGAPFNLAGSIMSMYDEATPYVWLDMEIIEPCHLK